MSNTNSLIFLLIQFCKKSLRSMSETLINTNLLNHQSLNDRNYMTSHYYSPPTQSNKQASILVIYRSLLLGICHNSCYPFHFKYFCYQKYHVNRILILNIAFLDHILDIILGNQPPYYNYRCHSVSYYYFLFKFHIIFLLSGPLQSAQSVFSKLAPLFRL